MALLLITAAGMSGCSGEKSQNMYMLDEDSRGYLEKVDHILNLSIVSSDVNVYKAEYEAGFIQGRLLEEHIIAARDNSWDMAFLTDPTPTFATQIPPTKGEIATAQEVLVDNW